MSVNLKNQETEALLHALAEVTGESLTQAATTAFRERLDRLKEQQGRTRGRALTSLLDLISEARASQVTDSRPIKEVRDELWGDR